LDADRIFHNFLLFRVTDRSVSVFLSPFCSHLQNCSFFVTMPNFPSVILEHQQGGSENLAEKKYFSGEIFYFLACFYPKVADFLFVTH
ncbi:MAG: hypothetical protein SPI57_03650, partial [Prevotella sp.]|nr:hypothetical protein [Prevotella sp.]